MIKFNKRDAISFINAHGILLVFPIKNRPTIPSLWSQFYPRSEMKWKWDQGADNRIAELWHLREQLSSSHQVVYTKWFQGRATFFSIEMFENYLCVLKNRFKNTPSLTRETQTVLEALLQDSPQSTKSLKRATELSGKYNNPSFQKALKDLWTKLLIVGYGEIDDGAFPSLAIGATETLFEELWRSSDRLDPQIAFSRISQHPILNIFFKNYLNKIIL